MRRFLTLVLLVVLALPAGISISGCYRNPAGNYCNGLGYGLKDTDVASITLQPATTGISIAYGQTRQVATPSRSPARARRPVWVRTPTAPPTTSWWIFRRPGISALAPGPEHGRWHRQLHHLLRAGPQASDQWPALLHGLYHGFRGRGHLQSVEVFVHAQVTSLSLVGPQSCSLRELSGQRRWRSRPAMRAATTSTSSAPRPPLRVPAMHAAAG